EEVVVTVQGYIVRCNLPPITRPDQIPKSPHTAKQSVVITDLGSPEFESSARAILQIHTLFGSTLPDDTLVPWKPMKDAEHICIEFANRYFKSKDDSESPVIGLASDIDPMGLLVSRCPNGEHTEDNTVLYFERTTDHTTGNNNYTPCKPVVVRTGQLVEIQASFCVVPITKGRFIMLSKLRAVCILNTQVQDVNIPMSPTKKTKRRVGYGQDGVAGTEETRMALKRLRIDETH
ncbi:hypothetical protein BDY19DRAFT_894328, partial [Irpex rosettiformis]